MDISLHELQQTIARETSSAVNSALREHTRSFRETLRSELGREHGTTFPELLAAATGRDRKASDSIGLLVRSIASGGGDRNRASDFAKEHGSGPAVDQVVKALAAGDAISGGFLLRDEMADQIIDILRPRSAVRSLQPLTVMAPRGSMTFPRLDSSAVAGYVQENQDIAVSSQQFGQVNLVAKKLAALVPLANELLRYASIGADEVVREDLLQVIAKTEDVNLIRGTGDGGTPKGLRYQAADANLIPANATPNLANVTSDLLKLIDALEGADVPMIRPGWIMSPRSKNFLMALRGTNDALAYQPEMARGTLMGFPFRTTTQIPNNLGGGTDSEVYLADFSEVILGEVAAVQLDVSSEAAYVDELATVRSAFTRDQTLIRCILHHDLAVRHRESVAVLTEVPWVLA